MLTSLPHELSRAGTRLAAIAVFTLALGVPRSVVHSQSVQFVGISTRTTDWSDDDQIYGGTVTFSVKNNTTSYAVAWAHVGTCGPFDSVWEDSPAGGVSCWTGGSPGLQPNATGTLTLHIPLLPNVSGNIKVLIGYTGGTTDSVLIHVTVNNGWPPAWAADQIPFPEAAYTPQITKVTSATVSAYHRLSRAFTISNVGNGAATFALATSCTGSLTNCNFSSATSGSATTTITLLAGASSTLTAYYTTSTVGTTGQLRLTMTAPPRITGLIEADTNNLTINAADLAAPVVSIGDFGYPQSNNGFPYLNVTRDTATVSVRAYDTDGLVGTPTLNVNGVAYTPLSVRDNASGMPSDKIATFLVTFLDGGGVATATVSDGYRTSSSQRSYSHDGSVENQPHLTVVTPTFNVPANFAGADTFVVANGGHETLTYALELFCSPTNACSMSPSFASVTVAAGASVRVPVPFSVGATGSITSGIMYATYYGAIDSSKTTASFTATAVPTAPPTIAVTPANGTVVTSSPLALRIDWCDYDDAISSRQVTWQGQSLPDVYVPTTRAGCFAAGTSTYNNLAINLWQQSLVASVTDASGHTVTSTTSVTFSPPLSNFAPSVTSTAGWHRLTGPSAVTAADTFTIRNDGVYTAAYAVTPLCGGSTTLSNCTANKGSVSLAPEEADIVIVTYTRSGAADVGDTLKLAATYTSPLGGIVADTGRKVITAASIEAAPVVAPVQAVFQLIPLWTTSQAWFTVRNTSSIPEAITLNWVASSGWGFMTTAVTQTVVTTLQLAPGETQYGYVNIVAAAAGNGTATLMASYVTAAGQTVSSSASIQLTTSGSAPGGIALSVSGTTQPLLAPNSARTVNFTVQNTSSTQGTVSLTASCSGAAVAWCDAPVPASVSLAANSAPTTVAVTLHTASAGGQSGTVTLTATSGSVTASGSVAISTAVGSGPVQIRALKELNPEATIARDQCLTIAVGDDAAYECGHLRLVHSLPTTTTMNKARTPTLIYLSGHANPVTLVATDVTIDATICPSQLRAVVRIGGQATDSTTFTWNGTCGQTATRRIVVPVLHGTRTTGVYRYSLEVRATVGGTNYLASDTTGLMAVVNRSQGAATLFGKGWWLDGLEQLFTVQVPAGQPEQIFWVGGDGSTRLYKQHAELNLFLADSLDRPDTLERALDGTYKRHLRNGAYVLFNSIMRHVQTVNAQKHVTQFNWNTSNQLASIVLPVPLGSSAAPTYTFNYTGGSLTSVVAPANANGARITTFTRGSDSVAIADPGAPAVRYKSDASNRIVRRTNRLGDSTRFDFDPTTSVLAHSKINMNPAADSIAKTFCAAEGSGRSACASSLADPANVATIYDGPRLPSDLADVTQFYVNRFGAPTKINDALNHSLTLYREDARWPFAVTAVQQTNGHLVRATYNNRGLIDSTWDTNPFGDGQPAATRYQWDAIYDKVTQITAPTFEVTRIHYDSNGDRDYQEDGRGQSSRTIFTYTPVTRQLSTIQIPGNSSEELQVYDYDPILGNLQRETTPLGAITNYRTNLIGQVDSVASQLDGEHERSQQFLYDLRDRLHIQRDIGPAMDTPRGTVPAATLEVTTEYDDEDRTRSVDRKSIPNLANTLSSHDSSTYDAAGRKIGEIEAGGRQQFWIYDPAGNVKSWDAGRGSSALITTNYDALNRPLNRTTPSVTKAAQIGTQFLFCGHPARFPYFPYLASGTQYDPTSEGSCDGLTSKPADLVIPADVASFTYDEVGNLTTANNNDARITREYYPNGALKHETQVVAILDETESPSNRFNTHIYKMGYAYDLTGRRLSRTDTLPDCPSCAQTYHYDPVTGFLDAGTDVGAQHNPASLAFGYDGAGRLTSRGINGSQATFGQHFDPDGRVDTRTVMEGVTTVFADAMSYDKVGHNTGTTVQSNYSLLAIPATNQVYNGLGALAYFSQERSGVLHEDQYQTDGMSNRFSNGRWFDAGQMQQESRYTRERLDAVIPVLTWQSGQPAPPVAFQKSDTTTIEYGIAGSVEYTRRAAIKFVENQGWTRDADNDVWDWNAYGADERLRMSQHSTMTQSGPKVVTTDYRYDALGRRVAVRTRWANCQGTAPDCLPMIEHTVWDGDQVLMERRLALDESAASGNWYGSVRYTHAGGIDEPLIIWTSQVGGWVPHRSWRGIYEAGTPVDGTSSNVTWPGQSFDVFYAPDARVNPIQASHWMGSLIEGKTDASGLQYMRNRYYDPKSGRFTQEDPLGLAGGMNLYGFVGGDPVNLSDPFGLCPEWLDRKPCTVSFTGVSVSVTAFGIEALSASFGEYGGGGYTGLYVSGSHSAMASNGIPGKSLASWVPKISVAVEHGGSESISTFEGPSEGVGGGAAWAGWGASASLNQNSSGSGWAMSVGPSSPGVVPLAGSVSRTRLLTKEKVQDRGRQLEVRPDATGVGRSIAP